MASSGTGSPAITAALARLAILRQADVSELTFDIYAAELEAEGIGVDLVIEACDELAHQPRREFEPAFPAFADVLRACHDAEYRRHQARHAALVAVGERYLAGIPEGDPALTRDDARVLYADFRARVDARRAQLATPRAAREDVS